MGRVHNIVTAHALVLIAATLGAYAPSAKAQTSNQTCDATGIGSASLAADGVVPTIASITTGVATARGSTTGVSYCLVKVLVPQTINIWTALPTGGAWNGRWQSVGGGVYAGAATVPTEALLAGYAAATTDTGHATNALSGAFGMLKPGEPNVTLQRDFATRSLHHDDCHQIARLQSDGARENRDHESRQRGILQHRFVDSGLRCWHYFGTSGPFH